MASIMACDWSSRAVFQILPYITLCIGANQRSTPASGIRRGAVSHFVDRIIHDVNGRCQAECGRARVVARDGIESTGNCGAQHVQGEFGTVSVYSMHAITEPTEHDDEIGDVGLRCRFLLSKERDGDAICISDATCSSEFGPEQLLDLPVGDECA
jgi:hypothetical protein